MYGPNEVKTYFKLFFAANLDSISDSFTKHLPKIFESGYQI